jgi:hypothetical protein
MRLVLAAIAATLVSFAAACGPEEVPPSASGQISLLPNSNIDITSMTTIEIRLLKDDDGGDLDIAELVKDGNKAVKRMELGELPVDYEIEHDEGPAEEQQWRVVVWLSQVPEETDPVAGDLIGSELFDLLECTPLGGSPQFCGPKNHVDVQINAILQ